MDILSLYDSQKVLTYIIQHIIKFPIIWFDEVLCSNATVANPLCLYKYSNMLIDVGVQYHSSWDCIIIIVQRVCVFVNCEWHHLTLIFLLPCNLHFTIPGLLHGSNHDVGGNYVYTPH